MNEIEMPHRLGLPCRPQNEPYNLGNPGEACLTWVTMIALGNYYYFPNT